MVEHRFALLFLERKKLLGWRKARNRRARRTWEKNKEREMKEDREIEKKNGWT